MMKDTKRRKASPTRCTKHATGEGRGSSTQCTKHATGEGRNFLIRMYLTRHGRREGFPRPNRLPLTFPFPLTFPLTLHLPFLPPSPDVCISKSLQSLLRRAIHREEVFPDRGLLARRITIASFFYTLHLFIHPHRPPIRDQCQCEAPNQCSEDVIVHGLTREKLSDGVYDGCYRLIFCKCSDDFGHGICWNKGGTDKR